MKYRIKKETYVAIDGRIIYTFYPQHKHWWCPCWHYYGVFDNYSDYFQFNTLEDAKKFIDWKKSDFLKIRIL